MAQPEPEPSPPQQPAVQGFRDAMDTLTERRYRELHGVWARAPERLRRTEAARRARNEMARRIAQHTGRRRVSPRTIARRARQDEMPPGVDRMWLQRWAAIDRAGGIAAMARQLGTTPRRVSAWRDLPRPEPELPGGPPAPPPAEVQNVGVETDGFVIINGKLYPNGSPKTPACNTRCSRSSQTAASWRPGSPGTPSRFMSCSATKSSCKPSSRSGTCHRPTASATASKNCARSCPMCEF
jgi:hypothetical protein